MHFIRRRNCSSIYPWRKVFPATGVIAYKAAQEQEADTAQLDALEQELSETYRAELLNTVNGSGHG